MLSPSPDPEVPMDYTSEYDNADKSSMDDSDEACSIPGSFSPDNNQDGTSGDQRYERNERKVARNIFLKGCYRSNTNSNTFCFVQC